MQLKGRFRLKPQKYVLKRIMFVNAVERKIEAWASKNILKKNNSKDSLRSYLR
jgi:hypothetical protein